MTVAPRVSIVVPLFNDEDFVAAALESCVTQTLADIEIICVDDASTDGTVDLVERYAARDPRVRLIRQPENLSAFQARRVGIHAATGPYILFLDGDDELSPHAAKTALAKAEASGADVVGFGVEIVAPEDRFPRNFEEALQPRFATAVAPHIVPEIFPVGEVANGHLWRYLFAASLLRAAYDRVPDDLTFYRANDLPITFLALAHASKYVSTTERLYRYHFRRGTSGHAIDGLEHFRFLMSGIDPITAIAARVREIASERPDGEAVVKSYESARLHIIGNVLRYCMRDTSGDLQQTCLELLKEQAGDLDVVRAAADFCSHALDALSKDAPAPVQPAEVRRVLLTTMHLETGGLQSVLLEQAAQLATRGYDVTIAVLRDAGREVELPDGVDVVEITGPTKSARLEHWANLCRDRAIDVIIDHHILYNDNWPWFTLAARAVGVPTIGWIHNFALRPIFDMTQRASFLTTHMRMLLRVVTLSPADVAFWKLQGLERVSYLPNPLSPLAVSALEVGAARQRSQSTIRLAWWGRLDRATKQVQHLLDVARELRSRDVDFHLTVVGPDSRNLTAMELRQEAIAKGVDDAVSLIPEQDAAMLLATLADADLMISTSAIEGFQLTIVEAQALGLPVVMYDLPWLATVHQNTGLVASAPDDPAALAEAVAHIADDPQRYEQLSSAARAFATAAASVDVGDLVTRLLAGELPDKYSPEPTVEDARILTRWLVRYAERAIRRGGRGKSGADGEISALRRERDRARRKLKTVMEGPSFRIGRALTFVPRKLSELTRAQKKTSAPRTVGTAMPASDVPPPLRPRPDAEPPTRSEAPDVTFVIPVYNSAPWLVDCLSSVLAQTGVEIEVICINDGSTDDSGKILREYARTDPRVVFIDQANSGQSVGRNKGIDAARGRYVIYLDSDDYWPEDNLASLVARADGENLDVLMFDCVTFRDGEIDEKTWRWYATYYQRAHVYREVSSGAELMAAMRRGKDYRPHVGLYLTRTAYLRKLGLQFIPGIVHQDNPYTFRLLLNAERASHERLNAYARRIRPGSTITTLSPDRSARGYFLAYVEMMREIDGRALPPGTSDPINNIIDYVYEGARKQLSLVSPETAETIRTLDDRDDAQATFATLMEAPQ